MSDPGPEVDGVGLGGASESGGPDEELAAVRELAGQVVAKAFPISAARARLDAGGTPDAGLDRELAAAGLTGLEVAEEFGGGGGTFTQLAGVLEALGEHVGASGLLASAALCAGGLSLAGTPDQKETWLPGLASGSVAGTVALGEWFATASAPGVRAWRADGGWSLSGRAGLVLDARVSRILLVPARTADGWLVVLVQAPSPGLSVTPRAHTDGTRCLDDVTLNHVPVPDAAVLAHDEPGAPRATALLAALADRAALAVAADSVGNARRVLAMTVEYVGQRRQFGRPIGSFQAVKHQAADMHVNLMTSVALVDDAARQAQLGAGSAASALAVSMAKDHACELAARNAGTALQLHGGIGYTWEYDLHLYFKRALLNEQLAGEPRWHRDRVLAALLPG